MGRTGKTNNRLAVDKNTLLLKEPNLPVKPDEHRMKLSVFIFCFCALVFFVLKFVSQIFHIIFNKSKFIFFEVAEKRFRKTGFWFALPIKGNEKKLFSVAV